MSDVEPDRHNFPDFFKYGVRFNPSTCERDVYRTILFQGLSINTTLGQLLQRVRGGMIVDAKILSTETIVGSNSALIVFRFEHEALTYEDYSKKHPIIVNGQAIKAKALSTPTYPMPLNLRKAMGTYLHTRCLEVYNFPRKVPIAELRANLRVCPQIEGDRMVHLNMRTDGVLEVHFSSVFYAGQGYGMFTAFRTYRGCRTSFVPDPCAQPVETLDEGCKSKTKCGPGIHPVVIPNVLNDTSTDNPPFDVPDSLNAPRSSIYPVPMTDSFGETDLQPIADGAVSVA